MAELDWSLMRPEPIAACAAALLLLVDKLASALVFRLSLRSFGRELPLGKVLAARLASLPGRYVPGKVAASGGMALILSGFGVPGSTALGATILPTVINLLVGLAVAAPLLFIGSIHGASLMPAWPALAAFGAILAVAIHPRLLLRLVNLLLTRLGREPVPSPAGGPLVLSSVVLAARYLLSGTVIWLLAGSLDPVPAAMLPMVVFSNAFAFVAGYIVFLVPAGIGVRESALLLVLGASLPSIALVAVAFRLLDVVTDVLLGAIGAVLTRRMLRSQARETDTGGQTPI